MTFQGIPFAVDNRSELPLFSSGPLASQPTPHSRPKSRNLRRRAVFSGLEFVSLCRCSAACPFFLKGSVMVRSVVLGLMLSAALVAVSPAFAQGGRGQGGPGG